MENKKTKAGFRSAFIAFALHYLTPMQDKMISVYLCNNLLESQKTDLYVCIYIEDI